MLLFVYILQYCKDIRKCLCKQFRRRTLERGAPRVNMFGKVFGKLFGKGVRKGVRENVWGEAFGEVNV